MNTTTIRMKSQPPRATAHASEGIHFEEVVTVKRILTTAAMLLVFILMALGVSTARASVPGSWSNSFESAARQSERSGKPLFVVIARTGCSACAEMENNLSNAAARRALNGAVKVRVESQYNPRLTARYAAGGTPTTVIFAPGNYNSPVYQYTGVMDTNTIRQVGRSIDSLR